MRGELIEPGRKWLLTYELGGRQQEDIEDTSDGEILAMIQRYYPGGQRKFEEDHNS